MSDQHFEHGPEDAVPHDPPLGAPSAEETAHAGGQLGSSMMEQLRSKHRKIAESKTVDFPLPGYDGELVARYRLLDVQNELNKINTKVLNEFRTLAEQALYGTIETLIISCNGMFYNDGEELRPIEEGIGDGLGPVKYDERLAEFLGFQAGSARETVMEVFGNNEPAIIEHGRRLANWMQGMSKGVMSDFMSSLS